MSLKLHFPSLIKLNDKAGATSPNIMKTRIIPIRLYVIQLLYYDRYEKRAKPRVWLSDIGGNEQERPSFVYTCFFSEKVITYTTYCPLLQY